MMINLRGRLRTWLRLRRPDAQGAVPSHLQPIEGHAQTIDPHVPPPCPESELMELDGDIVVIEAEPPANDEPDPDMRAWSEAFARAIGSAAPK